MRFLVDSFLLLTLNLSFHCPLAFIVSEEKSAINVIEISLYLMGHFALTDFKIFSLFLVFSILTLMYLGVDLFAFILLGGF